MSKYTCLEHNSSACNECVKSLRALEAEVSIVRAELKEKEALFNTFKTDYRILEEENKRYREALENISSFSEGDKVNGSFDEPYSAQIARDALSKGGK